MCVLLQQLSFIPAAKSLAAPVLRVFFAFDSAVSQAPCYSFFVLFAHTIFSLGHFGPGQLRNVIWGIDAKNW